MDEGIVLFFSDTAGLEDRDPYQYPSPAPVSRVQRSAGNKVLIFMVSGAGNIGAEIQFDVRKRISEKAE